MAGQHQQFVRVAITMFTDRGTHTEHWTTSYVEARGLVARYVTGNGLFRAAYGDAQLLFRDGVGVGHSRISGAA